MKIDLQNRAPSVTRTHDFRNVVERKYDVLNFIPKTKAQILADCWLPLGTVDDAYTDCYLTDQRVDGQLGDSRDPVKDPPVLVRTFTQLNGLLETAIGNPDVYVDQYDITNVTQEYWQLVAGTALYQIPGVNTGPAPWTTLVLKEEKRTDDGTLRKIRRTYASSGELSDTEEAKFDNKLLLRSITSLNSIPPTPTGWELVTTSIEFVQGLPVYRYQFVSGTVSLGLGGVIDTNIEYEISPDAGVTGITRQTIKYISDPSVVSNPIASPGAGYVLLSVDRQESDGYVLWTAQYAAGTGLVSSEIDIRENGNLYIYTRTAINAVPATPSATIGGSVALIKNDVRNGTRVENGTLVYSRVWAEGKGTISTRISTRQDGLREVTIVSIGTRTAPSGIIIRDDVQTESGYNLYTVSAMQGADGTTAVTSVTFTFGSIEKFTYPGRLKPFVAITGAFKALDAYKSPPVTTDISASILITYQTSGTLTPANTLWSPTDAAALYSQWVGTNGVQHNLVESYPGYRYVSGGTSNLTSTDNIHYSIFNQPILNGNNATINATGGPVSPDGNTYCLRAHLEPAFIDTTGTIYYRKTEVFATIPTQTALPV